MAAKVSQSGRGTRLRTLVATTVALTTIGAAAGSAHAKSDGPSSIPSTQPAVAPGSMYAVVDQIGARALWENGITGAGVNVAVIDTGVAPVAALSSSDKVVAAVDLSTDAGVPEATFVDTYGHGTHVAGIIAGRDPGADPATARQHPEWFVGVAPGAGIVSVKVADNAGAVDVSQVIAGVDWVVDHAAQLNIRVLNLSYNSGSILPYRTDPLTYAVERAWKAGIVVVVAAGNDGLGQLRLGVPANDPLVIAVGGLEAGVDGSFSIPSWATNGNGLRNPDVGAPGAHIDSLRAPLSRIDLEHPEGRLADPRLFRGSGSSQAAAVTSGAVALLLQARPRLTPDQVKAALRESADATGLPSYSSFFEGSGLVRVDRAVATKKSSTTQDYVPSDGTGALEWARGDVHIVIDGVPLVGEVTVLRTPWDATLWTGTRWTGGTWDGTRWTGGDWMGTRWTVSAWTGSVWMGTRWTSGVWSGTRWTDSAWSASSWTGTRWTGTGWSDASWAGATWDGTRWTGTRWTGIHWSNVGWG